MRSLPFALATAIALHTSAALACFPYVVTFEKPVPADGATDVPRDGSFALTYSTNWAEGTGNCIDTSAVDVVVRDDVTQEAFAGSLVSWNTETWCSDVAMLLWQPDAALPAGRALGVSVRAHQGASGLPDQTWSSTFTTGQNVVAPLVVDAPLEVSTSVEWVATQYSNTSVQ